MTSAVSQLESVRNLASEIEFFSLEFSAYDSDVDWATINSLRYLAKRFVGACKLINDAGLNNLLTDINTDIEFVTETADLHAELLTVAAYVKRLSENVLAPTLCQKVSCLLDLLVARATGMAADSGKYEQLRYELMSDPRLVEGLPSLLKNHRSLDSFWRFIQPKFGTYAERRTYLSEQFTPILDALEFGESLIPAIPSSSQHIPMNIVTPIARNKRQVFIVHGRDNEAKQEVGRFIESLSLEVIILHEQASSGMTIIEKIEHYSNDADFALVLYTACDHGKGAHESSIPSRNRARQNVVFEHGYLMAKLGREKVCALVKGDIETPNDISGVVYVPLDQPGAWKSEVKKELIACGYEIA
jgi:predicted nucleotide-binding protein